MRSLANSLNEHVATGVVGAWAFVSSTSSISNGFERYPPASELSQTISLYSFLIAFEIEEVNGR